MNDKKSKVSAKDFFMWLIAMVSLYASAVSMLILLFEYSDRLFYEVSSYYQYSNGIRGAISTLIVFFPVYLIFTRMLNKDIRKNPAKKDLWVRKWILFLTLFITGIAMLVDIIVLVNTFLAGEELTVSFITKIISVFVVMGGVFSYYLYDLKGYWEKHEKRAILSGGIALLLVLGVVVSGFFIMGSPKTQRIMRQDNDRVSNLQNLQYSITDYYRDKQSLPENLEDLKNPLQNIFIPTDPETSIDYVYTKTGDLSFNLCANFGLKSVGLESDDLIVGVNKPIRPVKNYYYDDQNNYWEHEAGEVCFERVIDPERYTKSL